MKNLAPERARWIRLRMGVLCGLMGISLGAVISTAFRVQVEDGTAWRDTAERQRQRRLHVEPKRGTIFDRHGTALAASVQVPSVSADVLEMLRGVDGVQNQDAVLKDASARLSQTLSLDENELFSRLATRHRFVWVKRRVTAEEATAIALLSDTRKQTRPIKGLAIEGEAHRYYPGRELAGALLGFVAPDGEGKDGLELSMDDELRGRVDEVRGLRDRSGRLLFADGFKENHTLAGHDVHLSLDEGIQHVAEREIETAEHTYETKGASIVVVDPNTGEVLALASTPGYNPNDYVDAEPSARRNRVVTDRFEPGSAMKVFTMAAALSAGTLKPSDTIFCEHGTFKMGPVTIHDTHTNDTLTLTQVLAKSSNIGALKVGLGLGEAGLYSAFRRFGFGEPTGLPLPGEASGVLRPRGRPWLDIETASASFGQGISVTVVQLAMAMSAIANGGKLLEPVLVKRVTNSEGETLRESTPHVRREVVSPALAKTLAEMLSAVTDEGGTGVEAALGHFRVAGKTSTAQKADPATGKYSLDKYTASFVGFVPADKPRLTIAVVLDEPVIGHYGGDLAGPVFRRVADASLQYLGITPATGPAREVAFSPVREPARERPSSRQSPPEVVTDYLGEGGLKVPDTVGMPARQAFRALVDIGLLPQMDGAGQVVKQTPPGGSITPKGTAILLTFGPPS